MLMVNALAGCGKTTTGLWGLGDRVKKGVIITPEQKAIVESMRKYNKGSMAACAFNVSIRDELKARAPAGVVVNTCNGFGNHAWCKHLNISKCTVDAWKNGKLFRDIVGKTMPWKERARIESAVDRMVGLAKCYMFDLSTEANTNWLHSDVWTNGRGAMLWLADRFDIDADPAVLDYSVKVFLKGISTESYIDFDDQNFLPLFFEVDTIPKFSHLLVDECLPSYTPVMMADGSSKQIVDIQIGDMVRSLDTETGSVCNQMVTATQKILNKKPSVKIKVQQLYKTGCNYKTNFVICTVDHKVWTTNRGWIEAGSLTTGDSVIVENAAITTQKGKITKKGKATLSNELKGNKRGVGNIGGSLHEHNRGGNGRGFTKEQQLLLDELGEGWIGEYIHNNMTGRSSGLPNHYKIDIANVSMKIAVELDGGSHSSPVRKKQDAKKDNALISRGWTIYRFTNKQVRENLQEVLDTICKDKINCPVPASVISIEPAVIDDMYVYDISVENTHCFYANGVLVHNCQDLSRAKQAMAFKMAEQLTAIGDVNQAIYGFSGADSESFEIMWNKMVELDGESKRLPLTVTRRCPKAVVRLANTIVPDLRAADDAPEGIETTMMTKEFLSIMGNEPSMIICRVNAPLTSLAFRMISERKRCYIQGRDIGSGLKSEVRSTGKNILSEALAAAYDKIDKRIREVASREFIDESKIEALEDKKTCIEVLSTEADTIEEFNNVVDSLFKDKGGPDDIRLSSCHKAKGLEHKNVFIFDAGRLRLNAKQEYQKKQENNLAYVAYTRSMHKLVRVYSE